MYRRIIKKKTEKRFMDISEDIKKIIKESKIKNGFVNIFTKHTTCGIKIMENEILSLVDITNHIEKIAPDNKEYQHNRIELRQVPTNERVNGVSHVRMLYFPTSETIPIIDGKIAMGKWQSIFLVEMDYSQPFREREIVIAIINGEQ